MTAPLRSTCEPKGFSKLGREPILSAIGVLPAGPGNRGESPCPKP